MKADNLSYIPKNAPLERIKGLSITMKLGECITINDELVVLFYKTNGLQEIKICFSCKDKTKYVVMRGDTRK